MTKNEWIWTSIEVIINYCSSHYYSDPVVRLAFLCFGLCCFSCDLVILGDLPDFGDFGDFCCFSLSVKYIFHVSIQCVHRLAIREVYELKNVTVQNKMYSL